MYLQEIIPDKKIEATTLLRSRLWLIESRKKVKHDLLSFLIWAFQPFG